MKITEPNLAFVTDDRFTILNFAAQSFALGYSTALVTLLEIRGGAARALGAQMVVRDDGQYCGFVSGGCVERAAAFEALDAIALGEDRLVAYGQGSPYIDIILPCGGGITLGIHVLRSVQPLLEVLAALKERKRPGLRYEPERQLLDALSHCLDTQWKDDGFYNGYRPCPRIIVYGRSSEAEATMRLAQAVGYEVHAGDRIGQRAASLIDMDTAVVLLYHDLDYELPILRSALTTNPFYIGALGSSRTHQARVRALLDLGYSQQDIARIKAPIGLFPRARHANTLALSVLADIAAVLTEKEL